MTSTNQVSWRRVNSPRNSECGSSRLQDLDWTDWWTDISGGDQYLHVASLDGETRHRVYCRHGTTAPRLGQRNGVLYWLVEREIP